MTTFDPADRPDADDVHPDLAIEFTYEEIIVLVGNARDDERIPGSGPDREDDVVAVLVSPEFKRDLQRPLRQVGPLWEDAQQLAVPVVELPGLDQDYTALLRRDAEKLFDSLADDALPEDELEIGQNVLARVESIDPAPVVSTDHLIRLAERSSTGEFGREDLPGA